MQKKARYFLQGAIGVALITLSLPAVYRAFISFQPRVIVSLFCFLLVLAYSRDRERFHCLAVRLWRRRNVR